MQLGRKISRLRAQMPGSPSPEWVAKQVGVHGTSIRRIESGENEPRLRVVIGLARLFNVSLDWLCDDAQNWPPPPSPSKNIIIMLRDAMLKSGAVGVISGDERKVVAAMRRLPSEMVAQVVGYVDGLARAAVSPERELSAAEIEQFDRDLARDLGQDPDAPLVEDDESQAAAG